MKFRYVSVINDMIDDILTLMINELCFIRQTHLIIQIYHQKESFLITQEVT